MNKFINEILEQPAALEKTLSYFLNGRGSEKIQKLLEIWNSGKYNEILFTGMGSSYFAPHTALCVLSKAGISSKILNAGELLHYHLPQLKESTLVTCISQSGESYEVVKILESLNSRFTCVGITNEENSTLANRAAVSLISKAGKEDMTSTKTYVSTLLSLSVFTSVLTNTWKNSSMPNFNNCIEAVDSLINGRNEWLSAAMEFIGTPHFVQIIGRGPVYSSVMQGAMMIMEAARNPAAPIYGGEFRHGPMEMSKKGFRAVIMAPLGATYEQALKLASDITRFEGRVLLLTNSLEKIDNQDIMVIRIPCNDEALFPVPAIIPLQFMVNQWAVQSGHEPGNFIMGAKVTVTE